MYCAHCGGALTEGDRFCTKCGKPVSLGGAASQPGERPPRRLARSEERMLAGVCGGIARYFGIDPTLVRIAWLVAVIAFGTGLVAYLICWIVIPDERNLMPVRG